MCGDEVWNEKLFSYSLDIRYRMKGVVICKAPRTADVSEHWTAAKAESVWALRSLYTVAVTSILPESKKTWRRYMKSNPSFRRPQGRCICSRAREYDWRYRQILNVSNRPRSENISNSVDSFINLKTVNRAARMLHIIFICHSHFTYVPTFCIHDSSWCSHLSPKKATLAGDQALCTTEETPVHQLNMCASFIGLYTVP